MQIIIGGASRSGKSIVARQIAREFGIPSYSLDYLIAALIGERPDLAINRNFRLGDLGQPFIGNAQTIWPALRNMVKIIDLHAQPYLIEGDTILPRHFHELASRYDVIGFFMGYPDIDPDEKVSQLRRHTSDQLNWPQFHTDEELHHIVLDRIRYSKYLRREAKRHGIIFIDSSHDFSAGVDQALQLVRDQLTKGARIEEEDHPRYRP